MNSPLPLPVGFTAGGVSAGLKRDGAPDLGLLLAPEARPAAAVFTTNLLLGAHVQVCRRHLEASGGLVRAILVNAKNANCATGAQGIAAAEQLCGALAARLGCPTEQVLMVSTGVIGAPLPVAGITAALDPLLADATADGLPRFAEAIRTTDTWAKVAASGAGNTMVCGAAKGSGMIHPDMATMLAFLLAGSRPGDPAAALRAVCGQSFHRLSVDGDTSPNDTVVLWCADAPADGNLQRPLTEVAVALTREIARDGEGASRLVTVEVRGAPDEAAAVQVGRAIAISPLTKTAVAGRDPNWGRILSAAARAGVPFDPERARVWIGSHTVYREGTPESEAEAPASAHLRDETEVILGIDLAAGSGAADCWTCDLTADYVRINADYRT